MESISLYYNKLVRVAQTAKDKGFFHIILSSSLVKVVSFISAIFLPRVISNKADYGLLVYIDNIIAYIMLVNGIGIANASLRYCAKESDDGKKKGYFLVTLMVGLIFDFVMIVTMIFAFNFVRFQFEGAKELLLIVSLLPLLVFLFEDIQLFLRACFENKKYSILSFFFSVMMLISQIGFAFLWGLKGVVLGRYTAVILTLFLGGIFLKSLKALKTEAILPRKNEIVRMIRFGIVMLLANSISYAMQLNETFILGALLKDTRLLADYKIASYVLVISTFAVQSVAVFIFPYFTKHMDDKKWIWKNFKKMLFLNAFAMIPIHIVLYIGSRLFITVLFGEQYSNVVPIMQTLLIASLGQTILRILTGNVLAATGGEKFNLWINILFMLLHVLIDIWAINEFGIYGAAIALAVVYYLSGIIMIWYLWNVCNKSQKKALVTI